jgi:hypothetical protein
MPRSKKKTKKVLKGLADSTISLTFARIQTGRAA